MSKKHRRKQINVRLSDEEDALIDEYRSQRRPIPSITEVLREALTEKLDREMKRSRMKGVSA